jgi:hypothetical protein
MRMIVILSGLLLTVCTTAFAETLNVSDDASLRRELSAARPGDVVRVASGVYRGGVSVTIEGTKDAPVTIEGATADDPPVFRGGASGLHLIGPNYVTLRNLVFDGATGNGLNIDEGGAGKPLSTGIVIERVRITNVGPRGNTDGIKLSGLKDFAIRDCTIEGWGGNAIDLVGCHDGVIERCVVRGKEGFSCTTGPQMKGGTSNVVVRDCLFDRAGQRAVNAGGSTGLEFFRPVDAPFEAKDLTIEDNVFIGSDAPVAFVGVDGAVFRRNTIVEPTRWVLRILQESTGERFVRCRNVTFERNLVVYRRSAVRTVVNIGGNTAPDTFTFRENWWWCADDASNRPQLPTADRSGVFGRNPQVTIVEGRPAVGLPEARDYGARPARKTEESR